MRCLQETTCSAATETYDQMCSAMDTARAHEQTARSMMTPDMIAGVTEAVQGHEPSAAERAVRSKALDAATQFALAEQRKTAFEQELLENLPLFRSATCPPCPLVALAEALTLREQQ